MIKRQSVLLRVYALLNICLFSVSHAMELPDNFEQKARDIPSLQSLCTKRLSQGYGTTYVDRCKSAFSDAQKLSDCINAEDNLLKNLKQECVNSHYAVLPCKAELFAEYRPDFLMAKNNKLYCVGSTSLLVWNLANSNDEKTILKRVNHLYINDNGHVIKIGCVVASDKDSTLYIGMEDGTILLWDTKKDARKNTLSSRKEVKALSENDSGDLCSADVDGAMSIWDISLLKTKQTLPCRYSNVSVLTLLADVDIIYAAGRMNGLLRNGPILIYDVRAGKCIEGMNPHGHFVTCLAKSKKEKQFYSSSWDGTVRVWDMRNMKDSVHVLNCSDRVSCCEENEEGTLLFACGDGGLEVWDVVGNKPHKINTMINKLVTRIAQDTERSRLFVTTTEEIKTLQPQCSFDQAVEIVNGWK